jgi:hypothetical protein
VISIQFIRLCMYTVSMYLWLYSPLLDLGLFFSVSLSFIQSVGLLGLGIPSQGRYLHIEQHKRRINAYRHPCLKCDSSPRSLCSRGRSDLWIIMASVFENNFWRSGCTMWTWRFCWGRSQSCSYLPGPHYRVYAVVSEQSGCESLWVVFRPILSIILVRTGYVSVKHITYIIIYQSVGHEPVGGRVIGGGRVIQHLRSS